MRDFIILTDSSADLTPQMTKQLGIKVIQLGVIVEKAAPVPNNKIDVKAFYDDLRQKKSASTSAANIKDFCTCYEELLKEDVDLLYLGFSSGLSGTYSAGEIAMREMREKYPDRKLYTVDTLCASLGEGMLVYLACQKKKAGATIDEVRDWVEAAKLNLCHWFTVDDLFFLKRGGRVSAATAVVGSMLQIKPVMHVDNNGKLINMLKARGRKAAIDALLDKMKQTMLPDGNQTVFISHGDCLSDAEYLASRIRTTFADTVENVEIGYVGPVIGAHSGPGTLALFFLGKER